MPPMPPLGRPDVLRTVKNRRAECWAVSMAEGNLTRDCRSARLYRKDIELVKNRLKRRGRCFLATGVARHAEAHAHGGDSCDYTPPATCWLGGLAGLQSRGFRGRLLGAR